MKKTNTDITFILDRSGSMETIPDNIFCIIRKQSVKSNWQFVFLGTNKNANGRHPEYP